MDSLLWFTTAIQDGVVNRNACSHILRELLALYPMFVTDSYDNHIFVVYMTFTFKTNV